MEISQRKPWLERTITLLLIAYFIFGYLPIASWNESRGFYHILGFSWEEKIPFITPFILGYSLPFFFLYFFFFFFFYPSFLWVLFFFLVCFFFFCLQKKKKKKKKKKKNP